jgi:hypothetical protein
MADRRQAALVGVRGFGGRAPYMRDLANRSGLGVFQQVFGMIMERRASRKAGAGLRSAIVNSELATKRPAANSDGQIAPMSS